MIRTAAKILHCNKSEIQVKNGIFVCKEHTYSRWDLLKGPIPFLKNKFLIIKAGYVRRLGKKG